MKKKSFTKPAVPTKLVVAMTLGASLLSACGGGNDSNPSNDLPTGVTQLSSLVYPAMTRGTGDTATTQDLLTAGLGRTGLSGAAPAYANPLAPTALELRRNAIYSNYRGLLDMTANGG